MKKLLIIVALFSANVLAGDTEIQTLIAKENALRVRFNNMAASHNEVVTKEQSDEIINITRNNVIHLIEAKHVTLDKCENVGEAAYKFTEKSKGVYLNLGIDKEMVERYVLSVANYSEAVCNAYLTRDEK